MIADEINRSAQGSVQHYTFIFPQRHSSLRNSPTSDLTLLTMSMYATALILFSLCYLMITTHAVVVPVASGALWAGMLSNSDPTELNQNPMPDLETNASSQLGASGIKVSCFENIPGINPTTTFNYYQAVQKILIRDDALVPRNFYLGPSPEQRWRWSGGLVRGGFECTIALGNQQPLLTDLFPVILVAHVAALIAKECITEVKGFVGGWASPGPGRGVVAVGNVGRSPS